MCVSLPDLLYLKAQFERRTPTTSLKERQKSVQSNLLMVTTIMDLDGSPNRSVLMFLTFSLVFTSGCRLQL